MKVKIIVIHNKLIQVGDSPVIYASLQRPRGLSPKKHFCLLLTSTESIDFLLIKVLKCQLRFTLEQTGTI